MADAGHYEPGVTTEIVALRAEDLASGLELAALREELPGLEPERVLNDWGRSQRLSALADGTLSHFLYSYWFRVEAEGAERLPTRGGALLIANRSGQLPFDAAMISRAIGTSSGRPVHFALSESYADVPVVGMLVTKLGGVLAHPANLQRLLADEAALVLGFPENSAAKSLRSRYRLGRFEQVDLVRAAVRAGVPIAPVAVLGVEEASPRLASLSPVRLPLVGRLPVSPPLPLPAKVRIRFLDPVMTDELGEEAWRDRGLLGQLAEDVRGLIQENLLELVAARRSVWLG